MTAFWIAAMLSLAAWAVLVWLFVRAVHAVEKTAKEATRAAEHLGSLRSMIQATTAPPKQAPTPEEPATVKDKIRARAASKSGLPW